MFHFRHYQRFGGRGGAGANENRRQKRYQRHVSRLRPTFPSPNYRSAHLGRRIFFPPFSPHKTHCEAWATEAIHYIHRTIMHPVSPTPLVLHNSCSHFPLGISPKRNRRQWLRNISRCIIVPGEKSELTETPYQRGLQI